MANVVVPRDWITSCSLFLEVLELNVHFNTMMSLPNLVLVPILVVENA